MMEATFYYDGKKIILVMRKANNSAFTFSFISFLYHLIMFLIILFVTSIEG